MATASPSLEPSTNSLVSCLFGNAKAPLLFLEGGSHEAWPLFGCLWMLESLTSGRPGCVPEYLHRKQELLDVLAARDHVAPPALFSFAQDMYRAVVRNDYRAALQLVQTLPDDSPDALFWPIALARTLVPSLRARLGATLRCAYLQVPVRSSLVAMMPGDQVQVAAPADADDDDAAERIAWVENVLLLPRDLGHKSMHMLTWLAMLQSLTAWRDVVAYTAPRLIGAPPAYALRWRL